MVHWTDGCQQRARNGLESAIGLYQLSICITSMAVSLLYFIMSPCRCLNGIRETEAVTISLRITQYHLLFFKFIHSDDSSLYILANIFSLTLFPSPPFSLCVCVCVSLSLSPSLCVCLSLYLSISLAPIPLSALPPR